MSDLDALVPQAVELVIDGEPLAIRPLKVGQLPAFLRGAEHGGAADVTEGLRLTGYFLERHVFGPRAVDMPQSRQMLQEKLGQRTH